MNELKQNEIWTTCVLNGEFLDLYEVSNLGNVRNTKTKRVLKGGIKNTGYVHVVLALDGKTHIARNVHRLVAAAFIGSPLYKIEVNHKNGIKTDNRLCNLEYVTRSQNLLHAIDLGTLPKRGERHHMAKLTEEQAKEIKRLARERIIKQTEIAKRFGIHVQQVSDILCGRAWKHLD